MRGSNLTAFFLAGILALPSHSSAADDPPVEPLDKVNRAFRVAYAKAREATLAKSGPAIFFDGDKLILKSGKERLEADAVPERYHRLKAVSHGAFAVFLLLSPLGDGPLSAERLDNLRSFRKNLVEALAALEKSGFTPEQIPRQKDILSQSVEFLDQVIKQERFKKEEATAFTRKVMPLIEGNMADAARLQIDGMHVQISAWRKKLSDDEWGKVKIVIMGSQMPRKGNVAVQYFAWLLGETGEGKRIVYAESLYDETRALNLLGTHLLDSQAAIAFFDDPERMERDLLADAARDYLKKLKKGS
jgi:hypothetical protein